MENVNMENANNTTPTEKKVKKIVILRCLRSEENCTGAACLAAFNNKRGYFKRYADEEVQLVAFMSCNGCDRLGFEDDAGIKEKLERILSILPDVVHVGICCQTRTDDLRLCQQVQKYVDFFKNHGIEIVMGTHSY